MSGVVTRFVGGSLAGLAATVPMTAAMEAMYRQLPEHERYPLPPRQVTMNAAAKTGLGPPADEDERTGLTVLAHFGYGAMLGGLYGLVAPGLPLPGAVKGVGFGLAAWAGNYLGLLPVLGLHPPATRHPPRRNALMIAAHVVWGGVLGALMGLAEKGEDHNGR